MKYKNKKVSLITGLKGQDSGVLAESILSKKYKVHRIKKIACSFNTLRINNLYQVSHLIEPNFFISYEILIDGLKLTNIIQEIQPDEIYNLGDKSKAEVISENPEYTIKGYQIRRD